MTARTILALVAVSTAACGGPSGAGKLRFLNQPPIWKVNDRAAIPKPHKKGFPKVLYYFDRFFLRRTTRLMEVPEPARAANVNSLDEVPDSTWFTNRIGVRDLTVDEVRRGPNVDDGPDRSGPWTVRGTKIGGASVGLMMKDARGVKYILKFDEKGIPDMETAADVIVQRLLWACGYNTPEDAIVYFSREQLQLAPDATVEDTFGNERPMTERDLENALAKVNVRDDGTYRGLASKFIQGVPVGGLKPEGTRGDDPNDVVPHEERREIRGQYAIFSWVDHTDVKYDNYLDMWTEDAADPDHHYVVHYALDFGKALGNMGWIERRPADGFAYNIDFAYILLSIPTLGLWKRPWEGADGVPVQGVGRFESERFDPDDWRPQYPWEPFARADRFDQFWGAKIIVRFSPEQIRAAVEQGKYEDPRATEYITETLIRRQRKIAKHWFREVAPLDRFTVAETGRDVASLCFEDLAIEYDVEKVAATTSYRATAYDWRGDALPWTGRATPGSGDGDGQTACLEGLPVNPSDHGYTIVRVETRRGNTALPATLVHLARGADNELRIIGLRRL